MGLGIIGINNQNGFIIKGSIAMSEKKGDLPENLFVGRFIYIIGEPDDNASNVVSKFIFQVGKPVPKLYGA